MTHNLPTVFAKIVAKIIEDERQQSSSSQAQVQQLIAESKSKDEELKELRTKLA